MRSIPVVVFLCFSACSSLAQTKPASATAPTAPTASTAAAVSYAGEAQIVEQMDTSFQYNADGTGVMSAHVRAKVQNKAGVRQFSVIPTPYASATQAAQYLSIRVTHADGTFTDTPPSDAMDMPAQITQEAPLYSDLKVLQVPVRGLRVGDTLEYQVRIQIKAAEAPSQFWERFSFFKTAVVLSQTLSLDVPADKYVQVWSPTVKPVITESGGRRIYRWSTSQLKPTSSDNKADDADKPKEDNKPSVAWTTFHSWQEVGDWYRGLAAPRAVPTDALRAQADEITRDAKTPEEQVRAIYSFVATHIRYVGIDFGIGRYEPHAAMEVLTNQYGDCKDKDTLLEALLHAKGFATAPALIGVGLDTIPELPWPGQFNHVITTVTMPSGQIWLDATPEITPFRMLISQIRDKQALVIPATGAASLQRTPADTPFPFVDRFEATATLKDTGELSGHIDITDRSDSEILLRALARNLAPAQWDQGTQYLARLMGFGGTTSNSHFDRADDFSNPMHLSYDYTRKPYGDWDDFEILPLFPVIELPAAPDKQPGSDIDLGAPRTVIAESRIKLPGGYGADLLEAVHVKTRFVSFDKTYSLENGELVVKRTVVVLQSKLPADEWMVYEKFSKEVSLGDENWIQLTYKGSTTAAGKHPPTASADNDPAAKELVAKAAELEKASDWAGAIKTLDSAKAINPKQAFLWSSYGYVAMRQNKSDEAKKGFRKELELHPDENLVVMMYAAYLHGLKSDEEASAVLSTSFNSDPTQARVAILLAFLQSQSSLPDAIATMRRAATASPEDHSVAIGLAGYLIRNNEKNDAITILKKQLDGADDPETLNDAGYSLAETGSDLPYVEQKVRKALDTLNTQTGEASIGEANAQSFQKGVLMVATWDTLSYILMQENKLDEARDYMQAAFANLPSPTVGLHYGTLLEKMGEADKAMRAYQMGLDNRALGDAKDDDQQLEQAIKRLKNTNVKPGVHDAVQSFQDERTFNVELKSAHKDFVSATFRLQFSAGATQDVLRVSGDPSLDEATEAIRGIHFPQYVPTHSTARLLRNAVVTCSPGKKECYFVVMPLGGINVESETNN